MINEQIPERRSCLSTYRDMHLEIIECINKVNISIYGLSAIVAFSAADLAEIIITIYSHLLFPRDYNMIYEPSLALAFIRLSVPIINVLTLYAIGQSTEKEVFIYIIIYYLNLL